MEATQHQLPPDILSKLQEKREKERNKHLAQWHNSRSAVGLIKNTKDYNMHLTTLSDQKANIVIGSSSVIISVGISQLGGYEGLVLIGLILLIVFASLALLCAILSVTPLFKKQAPKMDLDSAGFNPLFFGHYTDINQQEYTDHMVGVLKNQDKLYEAQIKDLYQMGLVLKQRKFKYLGYAYNLFFLGITVCLIVMAIGFVIGN